MESYTLENLSFTYPKARQRALNALSFTIAPGSFLTLAGPSGCGKTTLLRLLKPALSPQGQKTGAIYFCGTPLENLGPREQSANIGFVTQCPDNQLVTDKVWHELASIMTMHPSVLLLDEPTSQLDPIAAADFLTTLGRLHRELGLTIILSEQRLEHFDLQQHMPPEKAQRQPLQKPVLELREIYFRYAKDAPDVLKDLSFTAFSGEIFAILGGNGTGKTTALNLAAGLQKPYRGIMRLHEKTWLCCPSLSRCWLW